MAVLDTWWVWLAAALILALLELVLPGYILLGFSIGALAMTVLVLSPFTPGGSILLALFGLVSLGAWWVLRELLGTSRGSVKRIDRDINDD